MSRPAELTRFEAVVETEAAAVTPPAPTPEKDAEHGSTGWSAYDVWRNRVFARPKGYNTPRGNS